MTGRARSSAMSSRREVRRTARRRSLIRDDATYREFALTVANLPVSTTTSSTAVMIANMMDSLIG